MVGVGQVDEGDLVGLGVGLLVGVVALVEPPGHLAEDAAVLVEPAVVDQVLGGIFRADPGARMGGSARRPIYANAEDYAWQTGHRFDEPGVPADTHPRHQWQHDGSSATGTYIVRTCRKCSAVSRYSHLGWEAVA